MGVAAATGVPKWPYCTRADEGLTEPESRNAPPPELRPAPSSPSRDPGPVGNTGGSDASAVATSNEDAEKDQGLWPGLLLLACWLSRSRALCPPLRPVLVRVACSRQEGRRMMAREEMSRAAIMLGDLPSADAPKLVLVLWLWWCGMCAPGGNPCGEGEGQGGDCCAAAPAPLVRLRYWCMDIAQGIACEAGVNAKGSCGLQDRGNAVGVAGSGPLVSLLLPPALPAAMPCCAP
mmetsp:Transcript_16345/g.40728  ORF Transcript_16345/g.40728 Transcript_16345/m.40728 type:complete len:234 (-) Transcript_16345:1288-1989(-)